MNQPTLHMLMGLPGSGKSTLAKKLQNITGSARLSSDEYRLMLFPKPCFSQEEHDSLYILLDHNVEHLLRAGRSVIYDANLNRKQHRDEKYALAKKYNTRAVLWCLSTPQKLSMQRRILDQDHTLIPKGESPKTMFNRIATVYEFPEGDESYIAIDGRDITENLVRKKLAQL